LLTTRETRQERSGDLRLFLFFCDLVEAHIRRRSANLSPKEIGYERLLHYSAVPTSEISNQLGFVYPAYFSRSFAKRYCGAPLLLGY